MAEHTSRLRADLGCIAQHVEENTRVLDIGCGEGELLSWLSNEKSVESHGLDLYQDCVSTCVGKGLSVVQGNADTDLCYYPAKSFDYVVSSQMIQATHYPERVLSEMLRVGKTVIVAIPNFGHWKNRLYLAWQGKMPVTKTLSYAWYETPNIHFCTIADFILFCKKLNCTIEQSHYFSMSEDEFKIRPVSIWPNVYAERAVFVLNEG